MMGIDLFTIDWQGFMCSNKSLIMNPKPKNDTFSKQQVSISSTLNVRIFRTHVGFGSFFLIMYIAETTFVRKICTFNVDEIDGRKDKFCNF
jgi:hypothetical protein